MATTTCPHCEGAKKNYIIVPESDPPKLTEKNCVLCGGTGEVAVNETPVVDPPNPAAPRPCVTVTGIAKNRGPLEPCVTAV